MILASLRASTREHHARVEAHFASLLGPAPELEEYRRFLVAMYAFHGALEPLLAAMMARSPEQERTEALACDLRSLSIPLPAELCEAPPLPTLDHALGAAYVIDGSSLGARVLHRHLSPRLDASFEFLAKGSEHALPLFRALTTTLNARASEYHPRIVEGAIATFETLDRRLSADCS